MSYDSFTYGLQEGIVHVERKDRFLQLSEKQFQGSCKDMHIPLCIIKVVVVI